MLSSGMVQKRSSKKAADVNELAFRIVAQATGQDMKDAPPVEIPADAVSAVMREMGRRGGLKGGKARAAIAHEPPSFN